MLLKNASRLRARSVVDTPVAKKSLAKRKAMKRWQARAHERAYSKQAPSVRFPLAGVASRELPERFS